MNINTSIQPRFNLNRSLEPLKQFLPLSQRTITITIVGLTILAALAAAYFIYRKWTGHSADDKRADPPSQNPSLTKIQESNSLSQSFLNGEDPVQATKLTNTSPATSTGTQSNLPPALDGVSAIDVTQCEVDVLCEYWLKMKYEYGAPKKRIDEVLEAIVSKINQSPPSIIDDDSVNVKPEVKLNKIGMMTGNIDFKGMRQALDALVQRWFDSEAKTRPTADLCFSRIVSGLKPTTLKSQLTDHDIQLLGKAMTLRTIICGTDVTNERLEKLIKACPKIEEIVFDSSQSQISDAGLAHLKKLPNLKKLVLMRHDQITDDGLAQLQGLTGLQELDLSRCDKITDKGLGYLKELRALQKLSLCECSLITDAGIEQLKDLKGLTITKP